MNLEVRLADLRSQKTALLNQQSSLVLRGLNKPGIQDQYSKNETQISEIDATIATIELLQARQNSGPKPVQPSVIEAVRSIPQEVINQLGLDQRGNDDRDAAQKRAFRAYLNTGETRDLLTTSDVTGGALIPQAYADILVEAKKEFAPILDYVTLKIGSMPEKFEYASDVANEIVLFTEGTDPANVGQPTFKSAAPEGLDLFNALGIKVSYQMLQDSKFDVASMLKNQVLKRFYRGLSRVIITGADSQGNVTPNNVSLLTLLGNTSTYGTLNVSSATTGTLAVADLFSLAESIDSAYFESAVWLMSRATRLALEKSADSTGRSMFVPNPTGNSAATLLGRPVLIDPNMPSIATGHFPVILSDLRSALGVQLAEEQPSVVVHRERYVETLEALINSVARVASVQLVGAALAGIKIS
jgi:HK97 family phage major capsid protein